MTKRFMLPRGSSGFIVYHKGVMGSAEEYFEQTGAEFPTEYDLILTVDLELLTNRKLKKIYVWLDGLLTFATNKTNTDFIFGFKEKDLIEI